MHLAVDVHFPADEASIRLHPLLTQLLLNHFPQPRCICPLGTVLATAHKMFSMAAFLLLAKTCSVPNQEMRQLRDSPTHCCAPTEIRFHNLKHCLSQRFFQHVADKCGHNRSSSSCARAQSILRISQHPAFLCISFDIEMCCCHAPVNSSQCSAIAMASSPDTPERRASLGKTS